MISVQSKNKHSNNILTAKAERGVALILVIFTIALGAIIVLSLTDSTYISMRMNAATFQRVKAEYLLRSAVSLAQVLIKNDQTANDDPLKDVWMTFEKGKQISGEFLAVPEPNVKIELQIKSEAAKISLRSLVSSTGTTASSDYVGIITRLFRNFDFDNDTDQVDGAGPFAGRHFKSAELVANLVDYIDTDTTNYSGAGGAQGIEEQLPKDQPFRNQPIDSLASELSAIPGFTPSRVQKMLPHLTIIPSQGININGAFPEVLRAISDDIDDNAVQKIISFRETQGFDSTNEFRAQLIGATDPILSSPAITVKGTLYEVIAKVEYGTSQFLTRAVLKAQSNALPTIESLELY